MSGRQHKKNRVEKRKRAGLFPYGRTNARRCFLLVLSQQAGHVLTDLYPAMRPVHKLFSRDLTDPGVLQLIEERSGVPNWMKRDGSLDEIFDAAQDFFSLTSWAELQANRDMRLLPVKESIHLWARTHHLDEEWCLNIALSTIVGWVRGLLQRVASVRLVEGRRSEEVSIHDAFFSTEGVADPSPFAQLPQTFSFETSGWNNPFEEDPVLAADRLDEAYRAAVERHLAERSDQLKEIYGERDARRSHPPKPHFEWLVAYQCQGRTFDEIAREANYTRQAVSVPVHDLAELIGLSLRMDGRGRPRGAKDHGPRSPGRQSSDPRVPPRENT